ncbi:MAG: hypothetical protein JW941_05800, partial [Candidatus Coatesbacteria bacterium]|nr:hypothetical protein [Candidatus Coatesbacteria bacterium]
DGMGQDEPIGKLFSIPSGGEGSGFPDEDPNCKGLDLGSWIQSSPALDNEGNIYMITGDNTVFSISPDGVIIGRMYLPSGKDLDPQRNEYWIRPTGAIGPNKTLYVGCWDGVLYALQRDLPSIDEPCLLMAGFMRSELSASVDSKLEVRALVTDPESNVVYVEVYYEGIDLGWKLERAGFDDVANAMIFTKEFDVPATVIDSHMSYSLELLAVDAVGNESQLWPYFSVISEGNTRRAYKAPDWRATRDAALAMDEDIDGNHAPIVLMAGNPYSKITHEHGGDLYVAALVTDPDGISDIASVRWKFYPLGVVEGEDITQYAFHGLYKDAVLYFYGVHASPGSGELAIENRILVVDKSGLASTQFPAITVVP